MDHAHSNQQISTKYEPEAIGDLKPPPRMVLPSGEHNRVSVYTLSPNGKESAMI